MRRLIKLTGGLLGHPAKTTKSISSVAQSNDFLYPIGTNTFLSCLNNC